MIAALAQRIRSKPYETQVVLLTAMLATVRLLIALAIDANRPVPSPVELTTDFSLLLVFAGLLLLGLYKADFSTVPTVFGVTIVLLLGFSFLQLNGVNGTSRFNYYSGIYVIILLYSGKRLSLLLVFQFLLVTALAVCFYMGWPWVNSWVLPIPPDPYDFVFALIALGLLSYYLKFITLREIEKFENVSEELRLRVAEAKTTNHTLVEQGIALQRAQQHLEEEVAKRTAALERQQKALDAYNILNTTSLEAPIAELKELIATIHTQDHFYDMLKASHQELGVVFRHIKESLETTGALDRTKIRPQ